jgi:hypothetical protein
MKRVAIGVLATTLGASAALAQTAKPSPYEGVANPSNTTDDLQTSTTVSAPVTETTVPGGAATTSTTTVTTTTEPANTPPVARYLIPGASPQPAVASVPDTDSRPQLKQPVPIDPDAGIVMFVPIKPGELGPGTVIKMRLDQELSTATTQPGAVFTGRVTQDVMQSGVVAIPANAVVRGRVMYVAEGRRFRGPASIRLRPDEVILPDNSRMSLHAEVTNVHSHGTKTDDEGNIVSTDHAKRTLGEMALVGGGAAVVGGQLGGVPGALIGGVVGAGIVTTHWLLEKHEATLPANSEISIGLTEPMILSPLHN